MLWICFTSNKIDFNHISISSKSKGKNVILLSKSVNEDEQIKVRKLETNPIGLFGNGNSFGEITGKSQIFLV
jgi:hypothetical protein